jgi:putative ABC transport system ATP-binding protein
VPYLTALENVELPMILAGSGRKTRRRAEELLEAVDLVDRRHHRLAQMSGGEQQRVAIAVALANKPRLLLADEPTGEVDSATALTIYETFKRLNREYGLTTLIVSHDPGIARHVNRVVAIQDGKMATETVRRSRVEGAVAGEGDVEEEDDFHELVVLDSAGRLRVPKEYLDHFGIRGRVMLDLVEDGILIQPVPESVQSRAAEQYVGELVPEAGARSSKAFALLKATRRRVTDLASKLRRRKRE